MREEFFRIPPKPRGDVLNLLITGGSQGSRTLNQAARQSWPLFQQAGLPVRIVHQTGRGALRGDCATQFAQTGLEGEVVPFHHRHAGGVRAADLIVCRSGAGAVSELAAAGQAVRAGPVSVRRRRSPDAQRARPCERGGAARLVRDAEMTGEKLFAVVAELAADARRAGADGRGGAAVREAGRGAARRGCSRGSRLKYLID